MLSRTTSALPEITTELVRLTIEVDRDFHNRLDTAFPWGSRTRITRLVLYRMVEAVERGGPAMLGALMSGEFALEFDPAALPVPLGDSSDEG